MTQQPSSNNQSETDGRMSTPPRTASKGVPSSGSPVKANVPALQSSKGLALTSDQQGQCQLGELLSACFASLQLYGKEPEQLVNTVKLFRLVLAEFTIEEIRRAFVIHLKRSTQMPTPAEIVGLIQRDGRPPLDKSTYIALVQKRERTTEIYSYGTYDDLTREEKAYILEYEQFNIHGGSQ